MNDKLFKPLTEQMQAVKIKSAVITEDEFLECSNDIIFNENCILNEAFTKQELRNLRQQKRNGKIDRSQYKEEKSEYKQWKLILYSTKFLKKTTLNNFFDALYDDKPNLAKLWKNKSKKDKITKIKELINDLEDKDKRELMRKTSQYYQQIKHLINHKTVLRTGVTAVSTAAITGGISYASQKGIESINNQLQSNAASTDGGAASNIVTQVVAGFLGAILQVLGILTNTVFVTVSTILIPSAVLLRSVVKTKQNNIIAANEMANIIKNDKLIDKLDNKE